MAPKIIIHLSLPSLNSTHTPLLKTYNHIKPIKSHLTPSKTPLTASQLPLKPHITIPIPFPPNN